MVTALRPLTAGEPLQRAYDAGRQGGHLDNDGFLATYGIVPAGNPRESVQLFGGLEEALAWHKATYGAVSGAAGQ